MSNLGPQYYWLENLPSARHAAPVHSPVYRLARGFVEVVGWVYSCGVLGFWALARWSSADSWPMHLAFYGPLWIAAAISLLLTVLSASFRLRVLTPVAALGLI